MQKEKESMVGRRLYALIIDTLLLIVVGFLVLYIVCKIFNNVTDLNEVVQRFNENYKLYKENPTDQLRHMLQIDQTYIIKMWFFIIVITLFISGLIVYLIIPLILQKGLTLGKKIAKIVIITDKNKYIPFYLLILRQILAIIINVILGVFTIGIVPLINLLVCILQKDNKCIYDLICKTEVIDGKLPIEIVNALNK